MDCLPSAKGIELIEFGGMIPTSVTTAVMLEGGVRSYKGLRISRFGVDCRVRESLGRVIGKVDKKVLAGATESVISSAP